MKHHFPLETSDLRNSPYRELPADHLAYDCPQTSAHTSFGLPIGTQARFIEAAVAANRSGSPLNVLLTLRWDSLFSSGEVNPLRVLATHDRITHLVERLRKWMTRAEVPIFYIWVREAVRNEGEHWHIALTIPPRRRRAFVRFIATLTCEPPRVGRRPIGTRTEGEFACGELSSWHLAEDVRPDRQGEGLAAYLGKGEPSEIPFRGTLRPNHRKPGRGVSFGGLNPDGRYDSEQGTIVGTPHRGGRFYISNDLKRAAKASSRALRAGRPHWAQAAATSPTTGRLMDVQGRELHFLSPEKTQRSNPRQTSQKGEKT